VAERMQDGGGTGVEQAERAEAAAEREQPEQPVEAERRPTYKTLDEQQGRLTEAAERFKRGRRTIGLFRGPLVFLALLVLPLGLDGKQQALAAVLGLVVIWWTPRPSRSRSPGWSGCASA
jgi:Flp pilus assembly protein TadB